jgi:hypothetical protein
MLESRAIGLSATGPAGTMTNEQRGTSKESLGQNKIIPETREGGYL